MKPANKKKRIKHLIIIVLVFIGILIVSVLTINFSNQINSLFLSKLPYLIVFGLLILLADIIRIEFTGNLGYPIKEKMITDRLNLLLAFSGLLILIFQTFIFFNQLNVLEKQTQLLEETSVSNRPEILIYSSQGPIDLHYGSVKDTTNPSLSYRIAVGVTNLGKTLIPHAIIELNDDTFSGKYDGDNLNTYSWSLEEMGSLTYDAAFFSFSLKEEALSNFKPGKHNLKFKIKCAICEKQVDYQTIPICIYNYTSEKDCGEDWFLPEE